MATKERRKFEKVATFAVPGHDLEGSVRVSDEGVIRFEFPARMAMESFFPGWKTDDRGNIVLVPTKS